MRPAKFKNSDPVSRPKSAMPSGTTPICRFTSTGYVSRSSPRISIRPALGASKPVSILIVVDLPAPLGPKNPKNCPGSHAQVDAIDGNEFSEAAGQTLGGDAGSRIHETSESSTGERLANAAHELELLMLPTSKTP